MIRGVHPKIKSGDYDQITPATPRGNTESDEGVSQAEKTPQLPQLYVLHSVADLVAQRVKEVSKDRTYNSLLAISLLAVVASTIFIFAMLNLALFKVAPHSFEGVSTYPFLDFLAYSMGKLATTDLTSIRPTIPTAKVLALSEVFFGFVILIILVFSILTAARDAYREDFHEFEESLHQTASVIEDRIGVKYELSAAELELKIAASSLEIVNFIRKLRGVPEIPADGPEQSEPPKNRLNDANVEDTNGAYESET